MRRANRLRGRLVRTQQQLERVLASRRVLAEQVAYLDEVAADAKTRKLVAETPLADREWRDARRDRDRHRSLLEDADNELRALRAETDKLLERLLELGAEPPLRNDQ